MSTNVNRYIFKLALGAALAYAVGNALHTRSITYVLYGSILCIHPIAGDTVGYVLDKLKSVALGATLGIILDTAFQGNAYITLSLGLTALLVGGYWFHIPKRLLAFSGIVIIMAVKRWTDEMLDELASSVDEIKDSVDGLRVTAQALLQVAAQNQRRMDLFEEEIELMKQRYAENDERFNVLLEEVRYLIRGNQGD